MTTPTAQRALHRRPVAHRASRRPFRRDVAKQLLDIVERSPFTAVQAIAAVYLASGR